MIVTENMEILFEKGEFCFENQVLVNAVTSLFGFSFFCIELESEAWQCIWKAHNYELV